MRIGVVGLGTIASAVVEGLVKSGHTITVSQRNAENAARLSAQYDCVSVADNQTVLDNSDIVFVGLMDDHCATVLSPLRFREGQQVVSLMGGTSDEVLHPLVAPATFCARMIPFPSIAKGGSQIMCLGDVRLVHQLFGADNRIFELDTEAELVTWICAQAVLSPAVAMVKEAADWLAQQGSDPEMSETFLRELVGASLLADSCGAVLRALDTPGGYNQRLRQHMMRNGLAHSLVSGLDDLHG